MRGGLLGLLISFLRLGDVREEPTAKRVLNDSPRVADPTRTEIIDRLVGEVIPRDYLLARGMNEAEVSEHDARVREAVHAVLTLWDRVAADANSTGAVPSAVLEGTIINTTDAGSGAGRGGQTIGVGNTGIGAATDRANA
jgi:hypothetical protein